MAAASEILSAARSIMKLVTEGSGFDRVMRSVRKFHKINILDILKSKF